MIKLKDSLVIAVVGMPQSGKTTSLAFMFDAFYDMGVRHMKDKTSLLKELFNPGNVRPEPKIILYDDITDGSELEGLRKLNTIVVRIRRGPAHFVGKRFEWIENCSPNIVIYNDLELRRLEYVIRDAVKNFFPTMQQYKRVF